MLVSRVAGVAMLVVGLQAAEADPTAGASGASTSGPTLSRLSDEAQHVVDSLESHLAAVIAKADEASPVVMDYLGQFGQQVLDRMDAWGLQFRGQVAAKVAALQAQAGAAASTGSSAGGAGSGSVKK